MAIGRFLAEAVGEGMVFNMINKALKVLGSIFTEKLGERVSGSIFTEKLGEKVFDKVESSLVNSKTFEDEYFFGLDFCEADLSAEERSRFAAGVLQAEKLDKANGTRIARNFRTIVTMGDKKEGAAERTGKVIIEKIAKNCKDADEIFCAIQLLGAEQGPALSMEKAMHVGKAIILPFLLTKVQNFDASLEAGICKLENLAQTRKDDFQKRSFWKKMFLN